MAMSFWEAKRKRRLYTTLYLSIFFVLALAVAYLFEITLRYFAQEGYAPSYPYAGLYLLAFIIFVSGFYYLSFAASGGSVVAESMGGIPLVPGDPLSPKEAQLLNIVQELALASRQPMPSVYLIKANEINAFAAGLKAEKAVIGVTTGALEQLSRDELQGVIAHEFGHIASQDMKIGMRLAALLMGFFFLFYIGIRMMQGSLFMRSDRNSKGGGIALLALLIMLAGVVMWFAGSILRATVNRQREFSADASAVEYTRNPTGIANALKKILAINKEVHDMPKTGMGFSHLYLDNRSWFGRLFATHPPLEKRIAILEGKEK